MAGHVRIRVEPDSPRGADQACTRRPAATTAFRAHGTRLRLCLFGRCFRRLRQGGPRPSSRDPGDLGGACLHSRARRERPGTCSSSVDPLGRPRP
jgi:hypothetical protein